jgi:hypothetical protein
MKYGRVAVFLRQDSAEVSSFRYGLTLGIGTPKIMAGTGVFVRAIFALRHYISRASQTPSMILIHLKKWEKA